MLIGSTAQTAHNIVQLGPLDESIFLGTLLDQNKPQHPPQYGEGTYIHQTIYIVLLSFQFGFTGDVEDWGPSEVFRQQSTHAHGHDGAKVAPGVSDGYQFAPFERRSPTTP